MNLIEAQSKVNEVESFECKRADLEIHQLPIVVASVFVNATGFGVSFYVIEVLRVNLLLQLRTPEVLTFVYIYIYFIQINIYVLTLIKNIRSPKDNAPILPPVCYQSTNGLVQLRNLSKLQKEENLNEEHRKKVLLN